MTIQDWGAIGELVGALAVIVTLAYLAAQIRYARIATADQNRQSRVAAILEINGRLVTNPEARRAFDKVASAEWKAMVSELASIWGVERDEASIVLWEQIDYVWAHWGQYRSSRSPEDTRELENIVSTWYAAPPMSDVFAQDTFRPFFDPAFVAWIDEVLARRASGQRSEGRPVQAAGGDHSSGR